MAGCFGAFPWGVADVEPTGVGAEPGWISLYFAGSLSRPSRSSVSAVPLLGRRVPLLDRWGESALVVGITGESIVVGGIFLYPATPRI